MPTLKPPHRHLSHSQVFFQPQIPRRARVFWQEMRFRIDGVRGRDLWSRGLGTDTVPAFLHRQVLKKEVFNMGNRPDWLDVAARGDLSAEALANEAAELRRDVAADNLMRALAATIQALERNKAAEVRGDVTQ